MKIKHIVLIVLMFLVLLTATNFVSATNIEILNNSSSSEINNFFNKGTSLNGEKLAKGDTVIFQKGTYENLSLKITKSVNIKTNGNVIFDGYYSTKVAIRINTNNVNISSLKVQYYSFHGIIISSNNNKIVKNTIKSCNDGIYISGSNNRINSNIIQNNVNNGININKGSKNAVDKNTVHNNHLYGIYISNSNSNKIVNNNIKNNNDGISLYKSSKNTISKNTLKKNTWNGVYLKISSSNNKISQNKIVSNSCGVFSHISSNNIIEKNTYIKNSFISKKFY